MHAQRRLSRSPSFSPRQLRGFTLIELLVALTIVAILSAIGLPGFGAVVARSNVRATSSDLGSDLSYARAEAVRSGSRVTVCARSSETALTCGSDWTQGWLVFREAAGSAVGSFDGNDRLLREKGAVANGVTLSRTTGNGAVTFNGSGALQTTGAGALARFEVRTPKVDGRDLEVSMIGRLTSKAAAP